MSKQKYIAVLSDEVLSRELVKAIEGQGFTLMRITNFETHITHHFNSVDENGNPNKQPIHNGEKGKFH